MCENMKAHVEVAVVKMDGKFRVVIPKRLRERAGISGETNLFVCASGSLIFLKKVDPEKFGVLKNMEKTGGLDAAEQQVR